MHNPACYLCRPAVLVLAMRKRLYWPFSGPVHRNAKYRRQVVILHMQKPYSKTNAFTQTGRQTDRQTRYCYQKPRISNCWAKENQYFPYASHSIVLANLLSVLVNWRANLKPGVAAGSSSRTKSGGPSSSMESN